MKKKLRSITVFSVLALLLFLSDKESPSEKLIPNDYLWAQRAFPYQTVPSEAYYAAVEWANDQTAARGGEEPWVLAGPTNVGGRITDLAMHADDLQTIYAATASGGIWKSADAGEHWSPISDNLPTLSIGDIALDPSNKDIIYCGTGETNGGGGSVTYDGLGMYKSMDGGTNWQPIGLSATGSIGRIEVDPKHPNRVFVAAMGRLFANNPERGVYRSNDGGLTWEQKLFVNDSVGMIDFAMHPQNTDTVFAVSWERIRRPSKRVYGGPGSAIWRSTDGGDNWTKLTNGLPTGSTIGRMGIAISASNPEVLYATIARTNGSFAGVYKSNNNGDSWALVPQNSDPGYSSYGWWFGQIRVHPNDPDHLFNLGLGWKESVDAGGFWWEASNYLHADYHALYIHPANPDFRVVGNDGGIYVSSDGGATWQHRPIAITQFYTSEIDFQNPTLFSGGAQDNGTQASTTGALGDWESIYGGDGFVTLVNPTDNSLFYAESQYGGFGGSNGASAPLAARYNWNTPYIFDPNNPDILYFGAEKLFKSSDRGLNWVPISNDLSQGVIGMGGIVYGTITAIAASPVDADIVMAGTDDGNVWATADGGLHWAKISNNLPRRWVTRIVADLWEAQTAYLCLSGFRHDEQMAHIYKTTDLGQTWVSVSGNLPDVPVNDLILDPLNPEHWFIATDVGVFSTPNSGSDWVPVKMGMPNVPVLDLTFHAPTRTLLAATFGRSMYKTTIEAPNSRVRDVKMFERVTVTPNPAVEDWQVLFMLPGQLDIRLDLYDVTGKLVTTKYAGTLPAGQHTVSIAAKNLSAGVYFLKMSAGGKPGYCKKVLKSK